MGLNIKAFEKLQSLKIEYKPLERKINRTEKTTEINNGTNHSKKIRELENKEEIIRKRNNREYENNEYTI